MDLHACLDQPITLLPGGRTVIPTGIAIALPSADYVALVLARSGLGIKHGVVPSNCVGVIDSDYRGEIMVGLYNSGESEYTVQPRRPHRPADGGAGGPGPDPDGGRAGRDTAGNRRLRLHREVNIHPERSIPVMFGFFKKKSGEVPEEQERLQKAAAREGGAEGGVGHSGGTAGLGSEVSARGVQHSGRHRGRAALEAAGPRRTGPGWPCWS